MRIHPGFGVHGIWLVALLAGCRRDGVAEDTGPADEGDSSVETDDTVDFVDTGLVDDPVDTDATSDPVDTDATSDPVDTDATSDPVDTDDTSDPVDTGDPVDTDYPVDPTDEDGDGSSVGDGDCDDADPDIYPGATEPIDGVDFDCDGRVEWLLHVTVSADDEYEMCIDGKKVPGAVVGLTGTDYRNAEEFNFVVEGGFHVIGVRGHDTGGVISGLVFHARFAGQEFRSFGSDVGDTSLDPTPWRYFKTPDAGPQATWCDLGYDDTAWGPARHTAAQEDYVWQWTPKEMHGRYVDWIWDGSPRELADSYFRRVFFAPEEAAPPVEAPSTACVVGTALSTVSPSHTRAGYDFLWTGTRVVGVVNQFNRGWRLGIDDAFFVSLSEDFTSVTSRTMVHELAPSLWGNTHPAIASSGSGYAVAWEDHRNSSSNSVDQLFVRLLDADGVPLGTEKLLTTSTSQAASRPDIAWNGTHYGVVWQDERHGQQEIYVARLSTDGTFTTSATRLTTAGGRSFAPRIAWNEAIGRFLVVWEEARHATRADGNHEVYARLLDAAMSPVGSEIRVTNDLSRSGEPWVAARGEGFGVVWSDDRDDNSEIYFAKVSSAGAVSGLQRVTTSAGVSMAPSIAATDFGFGIAFRDDRLGDDDVYLVETTDAGVPADAPINVSSSPSRRSYSPQVLVTGPGTYAVAWEEERDYSVTATNRYVFEPSVATVDCR